jgi:hypothetical protein
MGAEATEQPEGNKGKWKRNIRTASACRCRAYCCPTKWATNFYKCGGSSRATSYTSQPEYWEVAKRIVGKAPSTLLLILPEAYLEKPGEAVRIAAIKTSMHA